MMAVTHIGVEKNIIGVADHISVIVSLLFPFLLYVDFFSFSPMVCLSACGLCFAYFPAGKTRSYWDLRDLF